MNNPANGGYPISSTPTAVPIGNAPATVIRPGDVAPLPHHSGEGATLIERIKATEIKKINTYLQIGNLIGATLLFIASMVKFAYVGSYGDFVLAFYILITSVVLVGFEFREKLGRTVNERVFQNFGFIYTAFGRSSLLLFIAFLVFTVGIFGAIVGLFFILLSFFSFFIIFKHPGYKSTMATEQQSPLKEMPHAQPMSPLQPTPYDSGSV